MLADYAASIGWNVGKKHQFEADRNANGKGFQTALRKADLAIQDTVQRDLGACERIATGGMLAVLWPACGEDEPLRHEVERLGSNRARALKLFLHNKPADDLSLAFKHAEALYDCGAKIPGGRSWKLYRLKQFSRDWTPAQNIRTKVKITVETELLRQKEPLREVKVDVFTRPAHPAAGPDDLCHTIIINIAASAETEEAWQDKELTIQPKVPNRKIILCITPVSKGFDCGWHGTNSAMANNVMLAVAKELLAQKDAPDPIEPIAVRLSGLRERPRFWGRAPEHKILSVQVKKLVVSSGPGTRTYFVSAKSRSDVYDAAPRNLPGSRIIAASLRVGFDRGASGTNPKFVNFDLGLPNRCSLRETEDAENYILKHCLEEWGLIDPEIEDDRPMLIAPNSRELSDLLTIDGSGMTRREAEATFGSHLETLKSLGALEESGPGETTLCTLCHEPHPADIRPSEMGWIMHCPTAGTAQVAIDTLPVYTSNLDALAIGLCLALPLKTDTLRKLSDRPVYYLGSGPGRPEWSALFAPYFSTPRDIDTVSDCLKNNHSLAPGILICGGDAPMHVPLPGKHVTVSIDELFALEGGQLQAKERRLAQALNRKTAPKRAGRPSLNTFAISIASARFRMKVSATSPEDELQAIKDMILLTLGEVSLPADKVMRYDWLSDHFNRLRFPETPE